MIHAFKGKNGTLSTRRIMAFAFFLAFCGSSAMPFIRQEQFTQWSNVLAFTPAILSVVTILILFFFTTMSDMKEIILASKTKTSVVVSKNE